MLFASFVVAQELSLQHVFEKLGSDDAQAIFIGLRAADGKLERVVSGSGVAVSVGSDSEQNIVGSGDGLIPKAMLFVLEGATNKLDDLRSSERLEDVDLGAWEERGGDLKRRSLGCGRDVKKENGV